jgi:hypothetical protein
MGRYGEREIGEGSEKEKCENYSFIGTVPDYV